MPTPSRSELLQRCRGRQRWPVLVIGAGINGCGTFRDLALQGLPALLVDRGDICGGTSAAPSRLIHGGLKYLETGELRLVAESVRERNLLLVNAPHVVHPLPTLLPVRSLLGGILPSIRRFLGGRAKLRDRGALIVRAGLLLYDIYGRAHRTMPTAGWVGGRRLREELPWLDPAVIGAGRYYDAWISRPERLGLELVLDGLEASPESAVLTHVDIAHRDGATIVLRDRLGGGEIAIEPEVVVNAGGPWIDRVNAALGIASRYIAGSKGSHLVLSHPELVRRLAGRMVYFGTADGRICLIFPYLGKALLGSTDIPVDDPDTAVCDDGETRYMLGRLRALFPSLDIDDRAIVYRYCGVRPLPAADAADIGEVSRDHSIRVDEAVADRPWPVLSLIGGKWTTFRAFGAEAADDVLRRLGRSRQRTNSDVPIGGGLGFPKDAAARNAWVAEQERRYGWSRARALRLLERYGTRAGAIVGAAPERPLGTLPDYEAAEIEGLAREELTATLGDVLFRRTTIAIEGRLTAAATEEVASILVGALGWHAERRRAEIAEVYAAAALRHGVTIEALAA